MPWLNVRRRLKSTFALLYPSRERERERKREKGVFGLFPELFLSYSPFPVRIGRNCTDGATMAIIIMQADRQGGRKEGRQAGSACTRYTINPSGGGAASISKPF